MKSGLEHMACRIQNEFRIRIGESQPFLRAHSDVFPKLKRSPFTEGFMRAEEKLRPDPPMLTMERCLYPEVGVVCRHFSHLLAELNPKEHKLTPTEKKRRYGALN